MEDSPSVPFWNVNLPRDQWTNECPDYLSEVEDHDKVQLAVLDKDYKLATWDEVKVLVETNDLEQFKRVPSQLHAYRRYIKETTDAHGSIMSFIQSDRLKWDDLEPKGVGNFLEPEDIKILQNDWPYGFEDGIVHLVVWTKFSFDEDPETGHLTPEARKQINKYIDETVVPGYDKEKLLWFHNWKALKSVRAIEHFHVLLHKPDPELVQRLTQGDVPMSQRTEEA